MDQAKFVKIVKNFTWSILEYFVSYITDAICVTCSCLCLYLYSNLLKVSIQPNSCPNLKINIQINPFQLKVPYLHPLKKSENQYFSDVFRGYRNGALGVNQLKRYMFPNLTLKSPNIVTDAVIKCYYKKYLPAGITRSAK